AGIIASTTLRPEVWICEEVRREVLEELAERGCLEACADRSLEFGISGRDQPSRCETPGGFAAKATVVVVARVDGREPVLADLRFQLRVPGRDIHVGADRLNNVVVLVLGADDESFAPGQSDIALPVGLVALAAVDRGRQAGFQRIGMRVRVGESERL